MYFIEDCQLMEMEEKPNKTRVVVVDDEFHGREAVKTYLLAYPSVEIVGEARNGEDAVDLVIGLRPDLLFLDIQMPGLTGLEVVQEIKTIHQPVIIFTTAYDQYAVKAFEANAIDYLLKPFDEERFTAAMTKALFYLEKKDQSELFNRLLSAYHRSDAGNEHYLTRILVKEVKRIFFVKTEDVFWFEASGDYVLLHTEFKSHLINYRLNELEERLNPEKFVRIHRSTIVNVDRILEFEPHFNGEYFITLQNKTRLKLSRTFKDRLRNLFADLFEP